MRYNITVEEIADENRFSGEKLEFKAETHDNIFEIVETLKQHPDFNNQEATTLGVGLKLFSAVMLKQKDNLSFKNLMPHFKDFMKGLKSFGIGK